MKRLVGGILALGFSLQALAHGAIAELSVFDRTEARRLPVHWHQGRAYVVGKQGNEYQVVVRNKSGDEILTAVSVDGVNVITGQTADPSQSGYVLSPGGSLEILGWRKDLSRTAAFYFTALADSYAARTGRPDNVGVIGVAVFRKKSQPISSSEAMRGRAAERAEPQLGTGHGRQEHSPAELVRFERASHAPAQVLTLYYDSHANLVARGIIRERVPVAPLPRPFPGFVPDPRG
jgi:hypothetical protein